MRCAALLFLWVGTALSQVALPPAQPQQQTEITTATQARRTEYVRMATAIGDDYFDGRDTRERVRRHLRVAKALGVKYLRFGFSWNGVEPERGKFNFVFWDILAEEASRAGITLIPYVAYTPAWAAGTDKDFWKQPPHDPEDFARVMRELALHYRHKITHWELWNEPDNKEYWNGTVEHFAKTIEAGARAVREVAPEDTLTLGGMSQGPGEFFQALVSQYHIERVVDVLALHAYPESWNEQRAEATFGPWIDGMDEVARAAGKKLWLNEMGYADYRYDATHASVFGTNTFYSYEHTKRYAADFLFKSFLLTLATGEVNLAGWYRIDDFREDDPRMPTDKVNHHLGVVDADGKPKPEFYAFRFFNALFAVPSRRVDQPATKSGSQAVVRVLQRKDGDVIVAGWIRSSTYDEVQAHTGMVKDMRREKVDVMLPCVAVQVTNFNVLGQRLSVRNRRGRVLKGVELGPDRVYVAKVRCSKRRTTVHSHASN